MGRAGYFGRGGRPEPFAVANYSGTAQATLLVQNFSAILLCGGHLVLERGVTRVATYVSACGSEPFAVANYSDTAQAALLVQNFSSILLCGPRTRCHAGRNVCICMWP